MKKLLVLVITATLFVSLSAQDKADIFGYFESQYVGASVNKSFIQLQTNKLRIDFESKLSHHVTFGANINFLTNHGTTDWYILDYLPQSVTAGIPPEMADIYVLSSGNEMYLDNAYMKLSYDFFDLTLGRQQISLGTGYAWNPTDLFNTKNLLDPTYEQPGHNAIRLDLGKGRTTLTALYSAGDDFEGSDKMLWLKSGISHFDLSLIAIEKAWNYTDFTQFDMNQMNFVTNPEKRRMLGATLAGDILGVGVWSEYAYNFMEDSKDFYELIVGLDYTFDFQTYLMIEYYRNTQGKTDFENYDFNDWMRYLSAEQKAIGRDQIYFTMMHPAGDLGNIGLSSIYSLADNSMALLPTLMYNIFENVDLLLYLNFYLGEEGAVFASNLGNGGSVRARVYF
ncbi:MAG: hypothetical protein K8R35_07800 [Bacteroidales bacterium]|nr:hypothetical protein [Bacteroidales bacterium]